MKFKFEIDASLDEEEFEDHSLNKKGELEVSTWTSRVPMLQVQIPIDYAKECAGLFHFQKEEGVITLYFNKSYLRRVEDFYFICNSEDSLNKLEQKISNYINKVKNDITRSSNI